MNFSSKTALAGWGRYPTVETVLERPESLSGLEQSLKLTQVLDKRLARGLGRAYGDAAVNGNGTTILMERLNRMLAFDAERGIVIVEPGVTIEEMINTFLPRGWFPLVVPGTKFVTVGGAIAADIHGKNHHREGSFVNCVRSFKLKIASGETVECSRTKNADLFWATFGGMGLTGFVTEAEIKLQRVTTAYIKTHTIRTNNLDETLACFDKLESQYQYSVAWIDCLAANKALGRSIVMFGNHAELEDLKRAQLKNPFKIMAKRSISVFLDLPQFVMNRLSIGAFNQLFWSSHFQKERRRLVSYNPYFFPLDVLSSWNRLYGKKGFVQYQCVVPLKAGQENLKKMLELSAKHGMSSFLAVLKRFGPEQGLLSFPKPGYTLTLDMPVKDGLFEFIDELNQLVMQCDGRVYLAKDSYLTPEHFRSMYPNYSKWLKVKRAVDPQNLFSSALSERLELASEEKA
jgi:FAD/FMN-containing dehydrogenase